MCVAFVVLELMDLSCLFMVLSWWTCALFDVLCELAIAYLHHCTAFLIFGVLSLLNFLRFCVLVFCDFFFAWCSSIAFNVSTFGHVRKHFLDSLSLMSFRGTGVYILAPQTLFRREITGMMILLLLLY